MIMKRKYRHILVNSKSDANLSDKRYEMQIRDAFLDFLGEEKFVHANPHVEKAIDKRNFIIGCTRGSEGDVILALAFIKSIGNEKNAFYTLKTSGTIKGLKEKTILQSQ